MCYRKILHKGFSLIWEYITGILVVTSIGLLAWITIFIITQTIKDDKDLKQFTIEKKINYFRVERFLKYNENISKRDFIEDSDAMVLYNEFRGRHDLNRHKDK